MLWWKGGPHTYVTSFWESVEPRLKGAKDVFINSKRNTFWKFFDKELTVHKMLKKPAAKHVTPVSESSWCSYLHNVFKREPASQPATQSEQHRHVRRWTGTELAMDSLIQLGRRHNNA